MLYATIDAGPKSFGSAVMGDVLWGFINSDKYVGIANLAETINLKVYDVQTIQSLFYYADYYIANTQSKIPYPNFGFNVSKKGDDYNSNSFTHGLLLVAGITVQKPTKHVPGWDKPLPTGAFGVYYWRAG